MIYDSLVPDTACQSIMMSYVISVWLKSFGLAQPTRPHLESQKTGMDDEGHHHQSIQQNLWKVEKAFNRLRQEECLGDGFKILMCCLVLLEVPWTIIAAIAVAKLRRCNRSRSSPEWPPEKTQRLAKDGLKLRPSLTTEIDNPSNEVFHSARTWVAECKLAIWVLQQNRKGISVPASLAVDQYLTSWGIGPHAPKVATHLTKFTKQKAWKKWLAMFRQTWGFTFASCPRGPTLAPEAIANKVIAVLVI